MATLTYASTPGVGDLPTPQNEKVQLHPIVLVVCYVLISRSIDGPIGPVATTSPRQQGLCSGRCISCESRRKWSRFAVYTARPQTGYPCHALHGDDPRWYRP